VLTVDVCPVQAAIDVGDGSSCYGYLQDHRGSRSVQSNLCRPDPELICTFHLARMASHVVGYDSRSWKSTPSAELQAGCAHRGWIWKRSQHIKKWNRRYFVLWPAAADPRRGRLILYYRSPDDRKPKGAIQLVPGRFTLTTESVPQRDFPVRAGQQSP
jgi:hypothetical protein